MFKKYKKIAGVFALIFISISVSAQTNPFQSFEDSLKSLNAQVYNLKLSNAERVNANNAFIKTLVKALKTKNSFNYRFDSLKNISIVTPPDRKFRIFTWHFPIGDGTYTYYGAIQLNKAELELFPLFDKTAFIKNPQDSVLTNKRWYGSKYYEIIPISINKSTAYALLGWKANNPKTTKKVIDVLQFKDGKPLFGAMIFDDKKRANRVIFEYTCNASMLLRYLPQKNMVVFDHLVPPDASSEGMYEVYGPDLTYDGYKILPDRWKLSEKLDLRNKEDIQAPEFITPIKANKVILKDR